MGWLEKTVAGGQRLLIQRELPMSLIRTSANRYLVTEAEQRQWQQTLLERMRAELVARKVAPESRRAQGTPKPYRSFASRQHVPLRAARLHASARRTEIRNGTARLTIAASHVAPLLARRVTESLSERIEPRSICGLWLERDEVERVAALGKRLQAAAPT